MFKDAMSTVFVPVVITFPSNMVFTNEYELLLRRQNMTKQYDLFLDNEK